MARAGSALLRRPGQAAATEHAVLCCQTPSTAAMRRFATPKSPLPRPRKIHRLASPAARCRQLTAAPLPVRTRTRAPARSAHQAALRKQRATKKVCDSSVAKIVEGEASPRLTTDLRMENHLCFLSSNCRTERDRTFRHKRSISDYALDAAVDSEPFKRPAIPATKNTKGRAEHARPL